MSQEDGPAKTVVITGATDGMGAAAARRLVRDGHRVVLVGRVEEKTRNLGRDLGADHLTADFARLNDVRRLADELLARYPHINVLANNAGGILGRRAETVDGFEQTFQVNFLASVLLTNLLLEALIAGQATVIQTSSNAARLSARLDLHDLNNEHRYSSVRAYGNAKQALILLPRNSIAGTALRGSPPWRFTLVVLPRTSCEAAAVPVARFFGLPCRALSSSRRRRPHDSWCG